MCVIIYKPADIDLDFKDLSLMWAKNNDGAGIAYFGTVGEDPTIKCIVEKGFMKLSSLKHRLTRLWSDNHPFPMAIHLRTATHGGVSPQFTHPFALSNDIHEACKLDTVCDAALMHNGVLQRFGNATTSDTADFVTSVLTHVAPVARQRLLDTTQGKFLLMQEQSFIQCGIFEQYKGLSVSTTNWIPRPPYQLVPQAMWNNKKTGQAVNYGIQDYEKEYPNEYKEYPNEYKEYPIEYSELADVVLTRDEYYYPEY
jgi:hypothetical protein